jgi:hypothetical protein
MAQIKRETANICQVDDILKGDFVKADGWNPSYFITSIGKISRVNLMGVLVSKEPEGLIFDDGSGRIRVRSFEDNSFNEFEVGEFVLIIGRPRIYNEQKYILPEVIKQIAPVWAEFRKNQIQALKRDTQSSPPLKQDKIPVTDPVQAATSSIGSYFQKIVAFIKDLDSGDGAPIEEVVNRSNVPDVDVLINRLIEEGEIFEIKPGKLKILE